MRLLVITQKVDIEDSVLGFFHCWLEKLAKKVEKLYVICLEKGEFKLPPNVKVFSLGKEKGRSRLKYVLNLYKYFWSLRKEIDLIFVHMNTIYVFLLWPLAKIFNLPIILWKAHGGKLPHFRKAIFLVDRVITSAKESLAYETPKKVIVGQGIDVDYFSPENHENLFERGKYIPFSVLAVGRTSPVKHYDILVEVANIIVRKKDKEGYSFKIIGDSISPREKICREELKRKIRDYNLDEFFTLKKGLPFKEIKKAYQNCQILVNLTDPPSLEKVVLEAMAMEKPVITSNKAFFSLFSDFKDLLLIEKPEPEILAEKIEKLANLPEVERERIGKKLREIVIKNHSLNGLVENLLVVFNQVIKKWSQKT